MDKNIELIEKIKNGDEEAFNMLLENHRRMIYKIIYNFDLQHGDYLADIDSLFQEGSIALYKAVFTYEKEKGMCFTSYAYMVIRGRICTYLRDTKELSEEIYSIDNCENIDYHLSMSSTYVSDNPINYQRELEFEETLNNFVSKLSEEDKQIFEMRSDNLSYKQISERLKINTKKVDNRLAALRKELKKCIKEKE